MYRSYVWCLHGVGLITRLCHVMIVSCGSGVTAPGMWLSFPDHLLNGCSHFEEVV